MYIYQNSCIKIILLLLAASLVTAALSYTLKANIKLHVTKAGEYAHCSAAAVREISKLEAATTQFAALHEDPMYFKLKDPKSQEKNSGANFQTVLHLNYFIQKLR